MKNLRSAAFILTFFAMLLSSSLFAQSDGLDVVTGKKYKVVLFDETEIIGRVMASDSNSIKIQSESKEIVLLRRSNILYITTDLTPSKYLFSLSLLSGINTTADERGYNRRQKPGFNIDLSGMFYLSSTKAVKIDIGYTHFKADYEDYYPLYYPDYPSTYTGGNVSQFYIKPNVVIGTFDPASRFTAYGSFGLGIAHTIQHEMTYRTYNGYDSAYSVYRSPTNSNTNALISIGGGLGYRITNNLGIHAEIEYNLITTGEYFFIFGGKNNFPIRAGISYTIF